MADFYPSSCSGLSISPAAWGYQAASGLSLLSGLPPAGWYAFDVIYYLGLDLLFFLLTVFLADRKLSPQAV